MEPRMYCPTLKQWIGKKTYFQLINMLGLRRDPYGSVFFGGWPTYILPNGDIFKMKY